MGTNFDLSLVNINTTIETNMKFWSFSLLDIFNGKPKSQLEAAKAAAQQAKDEKKSASTLTAHLKQDCFQTDSNGNQVVGSDGKPIPCAAPTPSSAATADVKTWTQADFAVQENGFSTKTWKYQAANRAAVSNMFNYDGWSYNVPVYDWCFVANTYRVVMMNILSGFYSGQYGKSKSWTRP